MSRVLPVLLLAAIAASAAEPPVVIAHRGGAARRPENTLAAFRYAISIGVPVLEFDLNLTADDALVLHHDSSVNPKVCHGDLEPASIRTLTLAQIKRFDCGSGERMPTFDEFLRVVAPSKAILLGETKMPPDGGVDPARFIELIDAALRKHNLADRFVLQSADYRTTEAMRRRDPAVRICLLNSRRYKPNYMEIAKKYGATHLMLRHDDPTPEQVRELKAAGLILYSGTANSESDWQKYVDLGFDGILSDDPVRLKAFLDRPRP